MNVMNRKLFANRAARRRLANMGGIMTSSPELMQAARMFQVGGQIGSPTAQKVKTVKAPYSGIMYDVYTDGRVVEANSGRTLDPMNAVQATIISDIKALPSVTNENSGIIATSPVLDKELGSTTQNMALRSIMDRAGDLSGKEGAVASLEALIATNKMEDLDPKLASQLLPPSPKKAVQPNPYQADIDAAVESFTGPAISGNLEGQDESGSTLSSDNFILAPDEGYPFPTDAPEVKETKPKQTEESAAAARETSLDQPNPIEKIADKAEQIVPIATNPDVSPEQRTKNTSTTVLSGLGVENVDNMSTKQRVKAYQDMFKEFLGEDDKDVAEEKWHNLAMIGFAIAAGESPSALANIANGLLEGSKVMKTDRDARRKREDSITSMAIEQVFSEKAAEKDAQLRRELAASKGGVGARDFRNPIDSYDNALNTYTEMLTDPSFAASILSEAGLTRGSPEAASYLEKWVSDSALKRVQEVYPDSVLKQYNFGVAKPEEPESYFEANRPKNKGAVYTFDGVTYKNDEVTGKPSQISD